MAGPAIRAWHMASTLAREHDVQLVSTQESSLSHPDFPVRAVDERELEDARGLVRRADLPGQPDAPAPGAAGHQEDRRHRHLRPVPPRGARAGTRPRPASTPPRRAVVHRRPQRAATAGRLLPLREREAARLLARSAGGRRSHQPGDVRPRREPRGPARGGAVRRDRRAAAPHPAGAPGRRSRHRRGRQGRAVGRRDLQLVRPAHAAARRRQAAAAPSRRCACTSSA